MFGQLFGKYLVQKGLITNEDYRGLIQKQLDAKPKIGTIAVAEGLMTEAQTEQVNQLQKLYDRRFGDIALEKKFLTIDQVSAIKDI